MLMSDLSKAEILMLGARLAAGERIFVEATDDFIDGEEGDIMELKEAGIDNFLGTDRVTIYVRRHRCATQSYARPNTVKLAPDATKTWNVPREKVELPEPGPIRIFDGLKQEIEIGDILALCDNGAMVFGRYEGSKGVNTVNFHNVRCGVKFKRMPGGLDRDRRSYTFEHSLKITDRATLDRIMINKLSA